MSAPACRHGALTPTPHRDYKIVAPLPVDDTTPCPALADLPPRLEPYWRWVWLSLREPTRALILRVASAPLGEERHMP